MKQYLIDLMALLPRLLRAQLGEAVGIIANKDFPDAWPTLCTELVAKIDTTNMDVTNGILDAAAAAFRRFDGAYDCGAWVPLAQRCTLLIVASTAAQMPSGGP